MGKFHSRACWKAWRKANAQTRFTKLLKQSHGMTEADYQRLWDTQGGVCGICQCSAPATGPQRLVVDHDHVTGRVRGLLCRGCNVGLGNLKDERSLLRSAIKYLDRPSAT